MAIAVVTGASSGLGKEYIEAIIQQYPTVDEFWLIARNKDKLKEIAAQHAEQHKEKTMAAIRLDLQNSESFVLFEKLLREREPEIKVLVNAAGYGQYVTFLNADKDAQAGMIDLNCRALTVMARLCLPFMTDESLMINVASIAAFSPMPRMSVYGATKAYVNSFSKALRQEVLSRGINVISVCPGPMDTGFFEVAFKPEGNSKRLETLPRVQIKDIARRSVRAGRKRRAFYTGGLTYKALHVLAKILPHNLLVRLTKL